MCKWNGRLGKLEGSNIGIYNITLLLECGMTSSKHFKFVVKNYAYIVLISEGDGHVGGGPSRLCLHVSTGREGQLASASDKQSHLSCHGLILAVLNVVLSQNRPAKINSITVLFLF